MGLADVYEVLLAILRDRGISFDEFDSIRRKKASERGVFEEKIFLVSVEESCCAADRNRIVRDRSMKCYGASITGSAGEL